MLSIKLLCAPRSICNSFIQSTIRCISTDSNVLHRTELYKEHVSLGGKMVPFAGYSLPVQYKDSIIQSHLHCRTSSSLFDVSHMGQLKLYGNKRHEFLETLVPSNIIELKPDTARLSSFINTNGGIIDDCMITNKLDYIYIVINAGCKHKDIQHITQYMNEYNEKYSTDLRLEQFSDTNELIALQGPKSPSVLQQLIDNKSIDLNKMNFMSNYNMSLNGGIECMVARCGYTGEDGFEISVPRQHVKQLFYSLIDDGTIVKPAGLGVRDSLRLEAGLCLYGHDMTEQITPIEADLKFTIQKRRRENGGFLGAAKILQQLKSGSEIKRIGFIITVKGPPARENADILDSDTGNKIGYVTSGTQSPCLNQAIGMGYVQSKYSEIGHNIKVVVRGKQYDAVITKVPFVETKYYRVPTAK